MDRIINVKVGGNYLIKDNKNAGVRGEANVTRLRITFDDGWIKEDYAKKVTFWDARGLNPVVVDLLPTMAEDDRTYLVPIPQEPMAEAGKLTFVIEGEIEGKVQRSLSDTLEVKDSPIAKNAGQPIPPTPDELTQVRNSLEEVKGDIIDTLEARDQAVGAKKIAVQAMSDAEGFCGSASQSAINAAQSCTDAGQYADKAWEALGKTSYIGGNGNWWCWDDKEGIFYDTGVKAQAGSTVYVGDNPPEDADVVIDPNGDEVTFAPYIGENKNWFVYDMLQYKYVDTGVCALGIKGDTPVKGKDYFTEEEIEAILKPVRDEIEKYAKSYAYVVIRGGADNWTLMPVKDDSGNVIAHKYGQVVTVHNAVVTETSKVSLKISSDQFAIFYLKDLAFMTEQENCEVTVFCVGNVPENDYKIEVEVAEVIMDESNG